MRTRGRGTRCKHRRAGTGSSQPPFWGRSHLLFQGDDVPVAGEVARQAQRQVVGFGAALQRG